MNRLLVFCLLLISQNIFAQRPAIIPHTMVMSSKYNINYSKHKGYIILKNGEKINGIFEYASDEFPTYNLKYYSPDGKLKERIKAGNIERAVMEGSDTSLLLNDSTVFIHLKANDPYLYRQLTYGPIKIYDRLFNVNEKQGLIYPELFVALKTKDQIIKFNSDEKFINYMKKNSGADIKWYKNMTVKQIIRQLNG